jgi:hypothetical protein
VQHHGVVFVLHPLTIDIRVGLPTRMTKILQPRAATHETMHIVHQKHEIHGTVGVYRGGCRHAMMRGDYTHRTQYDQPIHVERFVVDRSCTILRFNLWQQTMNIGFVEQKSFQNNAKTRCDDSYIIDTLFHFLTIDIGIIAKRRKSKSTRSHEQLPILVSFSQINQ